jgi:hypothetical protein
MDQAAYVLSRRRREAALKSHFMFVHLKVSICASE